MTDTEIVTLSGLPGSPYTRKMLALLRYRRVPYRFVSAAKARAGGLPEARVPMFPTVYRSGSDGTLEPVTDSSVILRDLERTHPGRGVIPPDPAVALLDMLLEDYADEWLTKAMFHHRWTHDQDIAQSTAMLPLWFDPTRPDEVIAADGNAFARRQIDRQHVVGSNAQTAPLIEASYRRFLALMNAHVREHAFLMGERPGSSDFAAFGQLTQLALFDPTPMAQTLAEAPRVYAWTTIVEDLSGLESEVAGWIGRTTLPQTLCGLFGEIGRTYVPVMIANARAVETGAESVEAEIDGQRWAQRPFRYQAKCVAWLREARQKLDPAARTAVDGFLAGTGCDALFTP